MPIECLKSVLSQVLGDNLQHSIKYVFNKMPDRELNAKPLAISEYPKFLEFFKQNNPDCDSADWLFEYFEEMVHKHECCGLFVDDTLVSCTDAPDMPYMQEEVQEIGINTLEKYRGNGFAVDSCVACAKEIIKKGKCPQWSTSEHNVASQKLAEKIGFVKLADVIMFSM